MMTQLDRIALQSREGDAKRTPPARHQIAPRVGDAERALGETTPHRRERLMYNASKRYLTAAVSGLLVAILLSLAAILVRSVAALEMDGKVAADALELRKSLP
jgi:hypothetical protein